MNELIIKGAKLVDGNIVDIAIGNNQILNIGQFTESRAEKVIDLQGRFYVSAGWIDAHTHCFPSSPIYYDEPDACGVMTGVTTVVDAGSVGANDIDEFYRLAKQAKTHVYALLNISKIGLLRQSELADLADIDSSAFDAAVARYPDFIVGLKARMSKSVVGENGIFPLQRAKEMQKKHSHLPVMVHIGNGPPSLEEIANLLTYGDIITHCFHGKPSKILTPEAYLQPYIQQALQRGVLLDLGHGGESFSFIVAEQAMRLGVVADIISSDIYYKNRINGPVYNLANVLNKCLCMGYSLANIIDSITIHPAQALHLPGKGRLAVGYDADLTFFDVVDEQVELIDADKNVRYGNQRIIPVATVIGTDVNLTTAGEHYYALNL